MNLNQCIFCKRPVLEIRGQFEKLDTYYLNKEDELFQNKIYGSCYSAAMKASKWGAAWYKKRLEHAKSMGFRVIKIASNHCVVDRGQAWESYYTDGRKLSLGKDELHQASGLMQIKQNYNVELEDTAFVTKVRAALESEGSYPLWNLIEHLGVADQILYPELLKNGRMLKQNPPAPVVGNWLGLKLIYDYQLPVELTNLSK